MNNIYKVIWSKAKNCYVVASEIARSHTKSASGSEKIGGVTRRSLLASLMALSLLCGGLGVASAADGTVNVEESTTSTTKVYTTDGTESYVQSKLGDYYTKTGVDEKIEALAGDVTTNKNAINALNDKTDKLSDDGTALTGMTTVNGTTVSGATVEAGALKVTGKISNDAGVTTTLADINDSMNKTTANEANIGELQRKTQKIEYDAANETTSINGMMVGQQVDMGGKDITNARALTATGKVTGDGVDAGTGAITGGSLTVTGKVTGNGVDAGAGDITTRGNVKGDTLETTGNATIGGALKATGKVTGDGVEAGTGAITGGSLTVTGKVTGNGVDAGAGDITTRGNVKGDTLETTGNATIGGALKATGKVTGDGVEAGTGAITGGSLTVTGKVTGNGVDAGAGAITGGSLSVTGDTNLQNTTVDGNLKVTGTITTDKMVFGETPNNYTEIDHGKVTSTNLEVRAGEMISSSSTFDVEKNEVGFGNGITDEQSSHKQTSDVITDTVKNNNTGDQSFHKQTSDVIMDNVKDGKNSNNRTQTKTETKDIITDENGNSSTTSQTASQNKTYLKDKDGKNTNSTIDTAKEYDKTIKGENGKTSTKQTATDITNTAEAGTIKNTAKNVTNEGTESVTNTVGGNEVKVSKDGVDIKAEAGKKITESVGTASRVVENDKITDNAGDSTVTTEKDKGTTFGKAGSTGTTNIYGDSIKTGTINAEDTTTDKLTAGAAANANGGRLTVDAKDGVKGSYKFGDYTSKSYILANTLKSGVDNDKEPTEDGFVGSRTDHYMVGDKAKLDETVKDADGSNVTNKTSTSTATTITDGTTTTKTEQDTKDITNTAKNGTITNDAKDIVTNASNSITEKVGETNVTTKTTTSSKSEIQNADTITSVQQTENMVQSYVGKKDGSATNVTTNFANASANMVTQDGQTSTVLNNKDGLLVRNTANGSSFITADGTNTGAALEWTNVKGNEISTGKVEANYVKMDYADVMKNLGVRGNAKVDKNLEVGGTSTLKGDVTMESDATVKKNLTVNGITTTKTLKVTENAEIDGTLKVAKEATFEDSVSIAKDLSVGGAVTASSYKVGDKTYISAAGINANDQKITNVADGSISEGSKDAVNGGQLYNVKNDLEGKVNKVGANAAAMANLHPMEFDPDSKWNIAAAIGNYGSETAAALGAFYRPNDDVMVNLSTAFGTGENMVGGGVSVRLGKGGNKLSREESNALKDQVNDLTARMDALLSVLNPNMSKDFPDVPENHWAYEAVSRLAGNDIVQGYPDGEFHGERTMTRYEMAEIIYNALSRGAEAEKELVEEFKPELQAMAASEKATAEKAEG